MSIPGVLPAGIDGARLMQLLRRGLWDAADILRAYARGQQPPFGYPAALNVEGGSDSPVSAADIAVNNHLLRLLEQGFPAAGWSLLSEENALPAGDAAGISATWAWILDPLDGTKDFLQGTGEYAVHLALLHRGQPLLGVVLIPEREELWFGIMPGSCWCEDRQGRCREPQLSGRTTCEELVLVASRSHRDPRLEQLLQAMTFAGSRAVGSVGCKVATILRGEADVYVSLSGRTAPKDWDMAAPEAVLRAAGGAFRHADGRQLTYGQPGFQQAGCIVASHGPCQYQLEARARAAMATLDPRFPL